MECRISVRVQNLRLCGTCFHCVMNSVGADGGG